MIGEKSSRNNLSASLGADGCASRMWERYAAKKLWAKDLVDEATRAVQLVKSWPDESPYKEWLELLRVSSGMRLDGKKELTTRSRHGDLATNGHFCTQSCSNEVSLDGAVQCDKGLKRNERRGTRIKNNTVVRRRDNIFF